MLLSFADYLLSESHSGQYYIGWQEAHTNVVICLFDNYIMAESSGAQHFFNFHQVVLMFLFKLSDLLLSIYPLQLSQKQYKNRLRSLSDPKTVTKTLPGCIGADGTRTAIWETLQLLIVCILHSPAFFFIVYTKLSPQTIRPSSNFTNASRLLPGSLGSRRTAAPSR
jgi:hypothetical protein